MSIKRNYYANSFTDALSRKRFDGSNWVDAKEGKRFDGSNWISVFAFGTRYYIKAVGVKIDGHSITVSSDGTLTFVGLAGTALPNITVVVDYDTPANVTGSIVATCTNKGNLPTAYFGFRNSTGLKDSSKAVFDGTLTSGPSTGGAEFTTPTVVTNPFVLFMGKTQLAINAGISFTVKFEYITINGTRLPLPFSMNASKNTFDGVIVDW